MTDGNVIDTMTEYAGFQRKRAEAAEAKIERLRAAIRNVRNNMELHDATDWQDSYRLAAIAVLSDALEPEE